MDKNQSPYNTKEFGIAILNFQGKATQKGVVRAGSNGQVDDQQIELYEKRLQNSINDLTRKSIEIRSRGRSRGGNSNRTPEQKRQEIVRSTLLLQRKLKQCKAEPGEFLIFRAKIHKRYQKPF